MEFTISWFYCKTNEDSNNLKDGVRCKDRVEAIVAANWSGCLFIPSTTKNEWKMVTANTEKINWIWVNWRKPFIKLILPDDLITSCGICGGKYCMSSGLLCPSSPHIMQIGSIGKASDLHSTGFQFKSWPGHRLFWQVFVVSPSPSIQMLGKYLKVGHEIFLPHPFEFIIHPSDSLFTIIHPFGTI